MIIVVITITTTNNNTIIIITITNTIPIMTKVLAINVQQLITGYGIGFSAPCLAQLVVLIDMINDHDYDHEQTVIFMFEIDCLSYCLTQLVISDDQGYHDDWEHAEDEDECLVIKSRAQDMPTLEM